jgi:hypothetical protein
MDTVRIEAPTRSPVQPAAPLDPPRDSASESRLPERSFEVESRGGYARTVVGWVAYLDDEAQTYMVLTRAGMLVRVPLRDITSSHGVRPRRRPDRSRRSAVTESSAAEERPWSRPARVERNWPIPPARRTVPQEVQGRQP